MNSLKRFDTLLKNFLLFRCVCANLPIKWSYLFIWEIRTASLQVGLSIHQASTLKDFKLMDSSMYVICDECFQMCFIYLNYELIMCFKEHVLTRIQVELVKKFVKMLKSNVLIIHKYIFGQNIVYFILPFLLQFCNLHDNVSAQENEFL